MNPFHRLALVFAVLAAPALAADEPTQGLRYPSLTPDGKSVVFCYRGDVWIAPVDGKGHADRLTIHEEQDTLCRVSPDGKKIAFASNRNGNYDVYVMPIGGGMPEQVTFHSSVGILCDWSPDGTKLLVASNRDGGSLDLYEVDLEKKGTPRRLTAEDGTREATYSPDGTQIVYVRGFNSIYWDNYEGSANYDIYVTDTKGGLPRRLTDTPGNERYPFFSPDAKEIWFVAEEDGVANFYAMPAEGGARKKLTDFGGKEKRDVSRPDLAWDGKTVVFELVGRLYTTDLTNPGKEPTPIPLTIRSDVRSSGVERRTVTSGGEQVHVSYDGTQCAFALNGDLWVMPAGGGSGRMVVDTPAKEEWPRFSPDGAYLAYQSDERGNSDLHLLELRTGRRRPLTRHPANDFFHSWSPDGRKLVFTSERSGNREIWLLDVETGVETQLTNHPAADDDAVFSPDGSMIAFDSGRDGTQAIFVMNADGSNVRKVIQTPAFLQVPNFSPDGKLLVYESMVPGPRQNASLHVVSVNGGATMMVSRDGSTACWRGDWIYFTADRGPGNSGIFRVPAPTSIVAGERVPFIGHVEVDRRKELEKVFDEAWTALKNGFYDEKMHGVDWNAMRKKYRDMAIDAENKDEFHNVIRQMLAELDASHLGIGGGERDTGVAPTVKETGQLGVEFDDTPLEDGARKVKSVLAGGPADQVGLRVGDVVEKIGPHTLKADTNLDAVLTGTVGHAVPISYRPHTEHGLCAAKNSVVKPIGMGALNALRYKDWVDTCTLRVKDAVAGKDYEVGYVHLNQMNGENLQRFQQAVQAFNNNKKIRGMILDVRNNGGGNIHLQLMAILQGKPLARVKMRNGPEQLQPALYWDKPVVVLINERSFSDAEVFPFMFKEAGLGKVIGVPTAGGVIGTNDITLSDGSRFRVPRTGFWSMDGTNLEGLGVKPDILVEETSEDRRTGRDPQLVKGIEVVLEEIEARKAEEAKKPKPEPKPQPEAGDATPQPAPVPATAEAPLMDAQVGEWVRYKVVNPDNGDETIVKITVTRVDGGVVEFEKEIEKGAPTLPPLPDKVRQTKVVEFLPAYGQVLGHTVFHGKVGDTEGDILQANLKWPDGTELTLSFTNAIPAYGLWKVEIGKQVVMEALEWGKPKPAPAPAADPADDRPPHPLADVRQGEWAKFRQLLPNGAEMEMVVKVVEVTDSEVVLEHAGVFEGRAIPARTQRRDRPAKLEPKAEGADVTYGRDTLTIAGKTLECVTLTLSKDGRTQKLWVCQDVTVDGLVRLEQDGRLVRELVDWGSDG